MAEYKKVTDGVIEELKKIVGGDNVVTLEEDLEKYAIDETPRYRYMPPVAVRPASAEEISAIITLANRELIPVIPRGLGTGLVAGSLAHLGGIVLSVERMDNIIEIDEDNMTVWTEPGVVTDTLQKAVEEKGLFYPVDTASLESCSIGGNVAMNAGGPRAMKYGVTANYVLGLEAVLPTGEPISYGGKVVKNVTGYNLAQLLVGTEGTLGIITKILLKLLPLPAETVDLLVPFNSIDDAADTVKAILRHKYVPAAIEFMEHHVIKAVEALLEKEIQFSDAAAHLIIQLDGNDKQGLETDYEKVAELCLEHDAIDVLVADTAAHRERLWEVRRMSQEGLKHAAAYVSSQDIVVPRAAIPEAMRRLREIADAKGVPLYSYGHMGDGNIHVYLVGNEMTEDEWAAAEQATTKALFEMAVGLGGNISGEHGIGLKKKPYLGIGLGRTEIEAMKTPQRALDPKLILNPGKIFDAG